MKRIAIGLMLILVLALLLPSAAFAGKKDPPGPPEDPGGGQGQGDEHAAPVRVQILAFNDFHGNLEHTRTVGDVTVGGAAYLATHIRELQRGDPKTVVISAGDMIGASPLTSALFHDEPTIEAGNLMGVDFNVAGNHEFDEGVAELLRMQDGGCHPDDGCFDEDGFAGADFQFLAANVVYEGTDETIFPPYAVMEFQSNVEVAFIGVALEETPSIVTASGVAGLEFLDEAESINALIPEIQAQGIEAIVVIIHQGGYQGSYDDDACVSFGGPIVDTVNATDDAVDLFITGHTHASYACWDDTAVDGRPVSGAWYSGRLITEIDMEINRFSGDVTNVTIDNHFNSQDVKPDKDVQALIDKYSALAAPLANRVIGTITEDITQAETFAGESALGDVIADAQLWYTVDPGMGGAEIAFMNPGGIRDDFFYDEISGGELPGEITYAEAFSVQPFNNNLVTMTLTGAQIQILLEQQFDNAGQDDRVRILQVSEGFSYAYQWTCTMPDPPSGCTLEYLGSLELNGVPIDDATEYRVTVNSFLADGGDGFYVLADGTNRLVGDIDLDALVAYFGYTSPVPPGPQDRITRTP